jgi:hypothetical protein
MRVQLILLGVSPLTMPAFAQDTVSGKVALVSDYLFRDIAQTTSPSIPNHTASFLSPDDTKNIGGSRGYFMLQGTF